MNQSNDRESAYLMSALVFFLASLLTHQFLIHRFISQNYMFRKSWQASRSFLVKFLAK
jgi:hypothetical protein